MNTVGKIVKKLAWAVALVIIFQLPVIAQTVYLTKTGEKYHKESCRYLSKSKIAIDITDAKAKGYSACSVCKPGGSTTPTSPKSAATQCTGTTKEGKRCQRMTTSASGRCYQH